MSWTLEEAITYYKSQGAPGDQTALRQLLREVQQEQGGCLPEPMLSPIARGLGVRESFLAAVAKRTPGLKLDGKHLLELCAGPNCSKHTALAVFAEKAVASGKITLKYVPCMRLCGKGPNLRWDGTLYHQADEALLRRLINETES